MYWNIADEEQQQFDHTAARSMALSADGNLLLTSDVNGTLSIWMVPGFRLIHSLKSDELVVDLAFSADGTRFYDIRGSFFNVWESDALIRANDLEEDEMSSTYETLTSEPAMAIDDRSREVITAVACDWSNNVYCCGFDDGSVSLFDVLNGKKVRNKVASHSETSSVIKLAWSLTEAYLASADDSSRVIGKRLERPSNQKPKWAVFGLFDFRTDKAVEQLLFSTRSDLLLISCSGTAIVMGMKAKKEICRRQIQSPRGSCWMNHPLDPTILIRIDGSQEWQYDWATLTSKDELISPSLKSLSLTTSKYIVRKAFTTQRHFFVLELVGDGSHERQIEVLDFSRHLPSMAANRLRISGLNKQVAHLVGCFKDQVVFLDYEYWLCTWEIEPIYTKHKRHFFLPKDLLGPETLRLVTLSKQGTLLCPRTGEVVIIRSGFQA